MIKIISIDKKLPYNLKKREFYKKILNLISKEGKNCKNIFFYLCSDNYLLEINKKYLNHDYFTDVITFDYSQNNFISSEIYISIDRIYENAMLINTPFIIEFYRICIHGVLHCIGYDDKNDAKKIEMTKKENLYLESFS